MPWIKDKRKKIFHYYAVRICFGVSDGSWCGHQQKPFNGIFWKPGKHSDGRKCKHCLKSDLPNF